MVEQWGVHMSGLTRAMAGVLLVLGGPAVRAADLLGSTAVGAEPDALVTLLAVAGVAGFLVSRRMQP